MRYRNTYGTVNTTSVTIDNLLPHSTYGVYVIATNEIGKSGQKGENQVTGEIG